MSVCMVIPFSATLHHMMTSTDSLASDFARFKRVLVIICVLSALFFMQAAVFKHAFEHLSASANKVSALRVVAASSPPPVSLAQKGTYQSENPTGMTCQKCLEDAAHSFVRSEVSQISHAEMSYVLAKTALPHNLPFLAPERANQRGPPLIS